uniref:Uncharacterized protein n=1 Tax=Opuntia streptacantha TaxID=393608 RepID=A0A7C9DCF1_OPUST
MAPAEGGSAWPRTGQNRGNAAERCRQPVPATLMEAAATNGGLNGWRLTAGRRRWCGALRGGTEKEAKGGGVHGLAVKQGKIGFYFFYLLFDLPFYLLSILG